MNKVALGKTNVPLYLLLSFYIVKIVHNLLLLQSLHICFHIFPIWLFFTINRQNNLLHLHSFLVELVTIRKFDFLLYYHRFQEKHEMS